MVVDKPSVGAVVMNGVVMVIAIGKINAGKSGIRSDACNDLLLCVHDGLAAALAGLLVEGVR
jgi:thiamine monophosphate kinase